jgi:hypothetical protein
MHKVALCLRNEEGIPVATISAVFTEEDLALFREFVHQMARVRTSSLLQRGMPTITNMKWEGASGMTLTCAPYTNAELHELLHVLRLLILKDEATSFYKVSALLGHRFSNRRFSDKVKTLRRVFEDGELKPYMQISVDDQPLLDESLLRMWLNGVQYHNDAEKAEAWAKLEQSLNSENVRAIGDDPASKQG